MAKFGVTIPQGWLLDLPEVSPTDQVALIEQYATQAESLNFDSIWLYDHFHTVPRVTHRSCFESWTTLTYLAARTHKIRLGTIVTCNEYRHPTVLAKIASVFDVLSKGRMEFGIGAGWYKNEYQGYGYQFEKPKIRIAKLREAVQIIKSMWTEESTTFHGEYYSIENAVNFPKPLQKPSPAMLIGGEGEHYMLRVVAEFADRCNFSPPLDNYSRKLVALRRHCAQVRTDFERIEKTVLTEVVIRSTAEKVKEFLKSMHERGLISKFLGEGNFEPTSTDEYRKVNVVGTPEECLDHLRRFKELGASHFILTFPHVGQKESMRLFAERVMPHMR